MRSLPFIKMHGLGNDFVVIDDRDGEQGDAQATQALRAQSMTPLLAQQLCDRRFGVGADQILWLRQPQQLDCDARMEILNADGSSAEMCGNGIRAVALYLDQELPGPQRKSEYRVETAVGIKSVRIHRGQAGQGQADSVQISVEMGPAQLGLAFERDGEELAIEDHSVHPKLPDKLKFFEVNVGNPHAVFFVEKVDTIPLLTWGPLIEKHPRFPARTNVEFVEVSSPNEIIVRVWERGAGATLACGTGACAAAVASLATGRIKKESVIVHLPGGDLKIKWNPNQNEIQMTGPAQEVYRGTYWIRSRCVRNA